MHVRNARAEGDAAVRKVLKFIRRQIPRNATRHRGGGGGELPLITKTLNCFFYKFAESARCRSNGNQFDVSFEPPNLESARKIFQRPALGFRLTPTGSSSRGNTRRRVRRCPSHIFARALNNSLVTQRGAVTQLGFEFKPRSSSADRAGDEGRREDSRGTERDGSSSHVQAEPRLMCV